jgi:hypothetical protein
VAGKVMFTDGTPLSGGMIEFLTTAADGQKINARGNIDTQGNFTMTTWNERDGAIVGEHSAIVIGLAAIPSGDVLLQNTSKNLDLRFNNYATSGLKFTVKPGENRFTVTVEREP